MKHVHEGMLRIPIRRPAQVYSRTTGRRNAPDRTPLAEAPASGGQEQANPPESLGSHKGRSLAIVAPRYKIAQWFKLFCVWQAQPKRWKESLLGISAWHVRGSRMRKAWFWFLATDRRLVFTG